MDISYYKKYEPIFGKWHIVRELGEGSFGKVFQIEHRDFGNTYTSALKAITIPQNQSEVKSVLASGMDMQGAASYFEGFVEEMVAEFALMSKLKGHSNIVSYEDHEVRRHKEGIGWDVFIRMELLTPLVDYASKQPMSRSDVIKLGIDMCKALEVCQKSNIIHRDIKPENIFVSGIGDFKLGDFGVARTIEKTMGGLSKKGTYLYMAPEVFKSEPYGASVDIYSLGIVLYNYANSNRLPFFPPYPTPIKFTDSESAMNRRIAGEAIPAPANADEELARVILKACAYKPEERYRSAADMRRDLEALASAEAPAEESSDRERNDESDEIANVFGDISNLNGKTIGAYSAKKALNIGNLNSENAGKAERPSDLQTPQKLSNLSGTDNNTALIKAIHKGDASLVSSLLAKGADPNTEYEYSNGNRASALCLSIIVYPNDEIAKLLIEAGADVNYRSISGDAEVPVLSHAIRKGNVNMVKFLLRSGADPNCQRIFKSGGFSSALMGSIFNYPNDEIAKLLIGAGADVNCVDSSNGRNLPILHGAIIKGNFEITQLLLHNGADPNSELVYANGDRTSALSLSIVQYPNYEIAKLLIGAGADVNYIQHQGNLRIPILFSAIPKGNVKMMSHLLSNGADPNAQATNTSGTFRSSALQSSISRCQNDIIAKMLVNAGADVNCIEKKDGCETPLLASAIYKGNVEMVDFLLSKGANPRCERVFADGSRSSALKDSIVECSNAKITELLCEHMTQLPEDVRGLKIEKTDLSSQTIQKLKSAGCKVTMF